MQQDSWNGKNLREMFRTGAQLLNSNSPAINALNVFPVPDGDTGTNMFLTMQSALLEANMCSDTDASAVAKAMAHGALMGARGNSGVILSQILRGLADGLDGKKSFNAKDMANALLRASIMADKAVSHPTEGTILTVMRDASSVAKEISQSDSIDLRTLIESIVQEARESVNRTPSLLPVLREAGVVDAGGQGLCVILEGLLSYLQGKQPVDQETPVDLRVDGAISPKPGTEQAYGYCTEFLIHGDSLDLEKMREKLSEIGEHVLVVGDEKTARVHIHTFDPGAVLSYGTSLGTLHRIKIDNMQEQHQEFVARQTEEIPVLQGTVATVAVASGEGMINVFKSLGTTSVLPGGDTMNPSVQDLLQAVETVPSDQVLILPNNPDILPTAQQVCELSNKRVLVVPSRTMTQGITALLSFNYEADLDTNLEVMEESLSTVRTGQIATAMRSMQYKNIRVEEGQIIGFLDEELVVAEYSLEDALQQLLEKMKVENAEILTAYYGRGIDWAEAEVLFEGIRAKYPHLEVEVIFGGQPHYHYLISVE